MTPYDSATEGETGRRPTAAELFAGVGGFHLALDRAGFDVTWSNQWEPATKAQHAFHCYQQHVDQGDFQAYGREQVGIAASSTDLGLEGHVASNEDIAVVLDRYEAQFSTDQATGLPGRAGRRLAGRRIPLPGLLRRADAAAGPRPGRQEGRLVVGDPPSPSTQARPASTGPLPLPRERRPSDQVTDRTAGARLCGDARLARRPRLRSRVASRQRGGLRLSAEAPARLHHRPARSRRGQPVRAADPVRCPGPSLAAS